MMLLVWAVVPYTSIQTNSSNIVSILAEEAVGAKWLRYWLVADAVLVLCAGIPLDCMVNNRRADRHYLIMWIH